MRRIPPAARIETFLHVAEVARLWTAQGKPNSGEFGYVSGLAAGRMTSKTSKGDD